MELEEEKQSCYVPLMGMMTHVLKFGQIPQTQNPHNSVMILIIPGNPGVIEFYQRFMEVLYQFSGQTVPVWGISHAGHVTVPVKNLAVERAAYRTCTLEGQIKHKVEFIRQYIPRDVRLVLIGHSIGCYMIQRMLDELDSHNILRCFQLYPTIERMAESPNGTVATPLLRYLRWFGTLIVQCASYLSPHLQYRFILWYFKGRNVPDCVYNASMTLFDPFCASNIMYMANMEMQQVTTLDEDTVRRHLPKVSYYYGENDHWCPKSYYYDMKKKFPHGDIRFCEEGYDHAFVLESSEEVAEILWKWLQSDLKKLTN